MRPRPKRLSSPPAAKRNKHSKLVYPCLCCFDAGACVCVILCRQHLTPCEAELTLSGHVKIKSGTSNYWLGHMIQPTNHVFAGGLPQKYPANRVSLQASMHADKIHYLAMCVKREKKQKTNVYLPVGPLESRTCPQLHRLR